MVIKTFCLGVKMFDHLVRQPVSDYPPVETDYAQNAPRIFDNYHDDKGVSLQNIIDRIERLERTLFGRQHD
jgi:hypothetical protein